MNHIWIVPLFILSYVYYGRDATSLAYCSIHYMLVRTTPYHYVYEDYWRHNYNQGKFISNDTNYSYINYYPKENVVWNKKPVCNEKTFLLLLFFVRKADVSRRNLIRRHMHQGMIANNKSTNYMFVVCADHNEIETMIKLRKENEEYGDLLISVHKDTYLNLPLTMLDSFFWVREYCKSAAFVGKADGDTWVNVNNLISYLKTVNQTRFYGGYCVKTILHSSFRGNRNNVPIDYPYRECEFNAGGGYLLSRDVVPYVSIGSLYSDLILHAEDVMMGDILGKVGILPYKGKSEYTLYSNLEWFPNKTIPTNAVFVHNIKDLSELSTIYESGLRY